MALKDHDLSLSLMRYFQFLNKDNIVIIIMFVSLKALSWVLSDIQKCRVMSSLDYGFFK